MTITVDQLREVLDYDPATGAFRWRYRSGRGVTRLNGRTAGRVGPDGRIVIRIAGRHYLAHRLAWLYVTGEWPRDEIDHVDLDVGNNRFGNLREASRSQNCANKRPPPSKSGMRGVYLVGSPDRPRYRAAIKFNGRMIYLGRYDEPVAAQAAYATAAAALFGEFAHRGIAEDAHA